jgi:hypothetical protein
MIHLFFVDLSVGCTKVEIIDMPVENSAPQMKIAMEYSAVGVWMFTMVWVGSTVRI